LNKTLKEYMRTIGDVVTYVEKRKRRNTNADIERSDPVSN